MLMMDFTVQSPPELVPRLQLLAERYLRAVERSPEALAAHAAESTPDLSPPGTTGLDKA